MASYQPPVEWKEWSEWMAAGLYGPSRWRLTPLLLGILFACGRRTVTSWPRAAGVSDDYRDYYYFLQSVGTRWFPLGARVLRLVVEEVFNKVFRVLVVQQSVSRAGGNRQGEERTGVLLLHRHQRKRRGDPGDVCRPVGHRAGVFTT